MTQNNKLMCFFFFCVNTADTYTILPSWINNGVTATADEQRSNEDILTAVTSCSQCSFRRSHVRHADHNSLWSSHDIPGHWLQPFAQTKSTPLSLSALKVCLLPFFPPFSFTPVSLFLHHSHVSTQKSQTWSLWPSLAGARKDLLPLPPVKPTENL